MPARKKEERRRGKKRKNKEIGEERSSNGHAETEAAAAAPFFYDTQGVNKEEDQSTPSWLIEDKIAESSSQLRIEPSTPFGLVDLEFKAYLRSAHIKLNELMETALEEGRTIHEDEEVKILRNAMLNEIKGKELTLATDADTSRILEDMLYSFSERQIRVLADSLAVSSENLFKLSCHRFGSHLLQSTLIALQSVACKEESELQGGEKAKGKLYSRDENDLRSAVDLVLDISKELTSNSVALLSDQFGTHVLRTVLLVLSGQGTSTAVHHQRSKKSQVYQQKTQSTRLVKKQEVNLNLVVPASFAESLQDILGAIKNGTDENKVKNLITDPIAGPTLALVIELSLRGHGVKGVKEDPLLKAIMSGLITGEGFNYLDNLMKDSVGSHMLQRLLQHVDEQTIQVFWHKCIEESLCKLGVHSIANFVVATLVRRLGEFELERACEEVALAGDKLVKNGKIGILIAMADRAREISQRNPVKQIAPNEVRNYKKKARNVWSDGEIQSKAARAILKAFGFHEEQDKEDEVGYLVKVLISGKAKKGYKKEMRRLEMEHEKLPAKKTANKVLEEQLLQQEDSGVQEEELLISIQGSLLCQSLLRLPEPGNSPVLESILGLSSLLSLTSNPTTVHILLAFYQSDANCTFTQRTALSTKILSELSSMLGDKFGSRVIDCVFDTSDAFFKEKVMKQCIQDEYSLLSSHYSRFFLKRVNMSLFRKDIGQWKQWIKEKGHIKKQQQQPQQQIAQANQDEAEAQIAERQLKRARVDEELDTILAGI